MFYFEIGNKGSRTHKQAKLDALAPKKGQAIMKKENFRGLLGGSVTCRLAILLLPLVIFSATSCGEGDSYTSHFSQAQNQTPKVGVLFASYGDVSSLEEVEQYVKNSINDPDIIPIPDWVRPFVAWLGWEIRKSHVYQEYEVIKDLLRYRQASREQSDIVEKKLNQAGLNAKTYIGFVLANPSIEEALTQAQSDGIEELVIINQGAVYAKVTTELNFRETREYLQNHAEWKVKVIGVKSFLEDQRFLKLVALSTQVAIQKEFPTIQPSDLCLFFPLHGVYTKILNEGDPSYSQMMYGVNAMKGFFRNHPVFHGFQNHDEFGWVSWTQPSVTVVAEEIGRHPCSAVIINGRLTFTVDNVETLADEVINQKERILSQNRQKNVVVLPMFNKEESFADYMVTLTKEALAGYGDIVIVD